MPIGTTTLLVLKSLAGNSPVSLTPLQNALAPYEGWMAIVWWSMWVATLGYLMLRYIIIPLLRKWWH